MEQLNFHKQKLYSLVIAGIALISLLLPWYSLGLFGSLNGFRGWGLLTLIGVIAVAAVSWMGDKSAAYDDNSKKIVLAGFGAIALGALITLITTVFSAGIGLWIALIAGAAGLALLLGFIKIPEKPGSNNPPKV